MKQLTEEQLQDNWEKLLQLIEDMFEGERKTRLLEMYKDLEDRMVVAPASGKEEYHNCHVGGYVEHVLHVVDTARKMEKTYIDCGGFVDWTEEELVFSALHHDLGKVGDLEEEYYIPQDNDWRRKTLGEVYTHNTNIDNLRVPDRALWLLQYYGVKVSLIETLSIKLADGMYDDGNIKYLKSYSKDTSLKSNLPYIIHQADMATTRIEYEQWLNSDDDSDSKPKIKKTIKKQVEKVVVESTTKKKEDLQDLFADIFGEKK